MVKIASGFYQHPLSTFELTRCINSKLFEVQIQALVNLTKQVCYSGSQPSVYMSTLELCLEVRDGKQKKE